MNKFEPIRPADVFAEAKTFLGWNPSDEQNLRQLAPTFETNGPAITDAFYERIGQVPKLAPMIEGRVDALKATHHRWMGQLFDGIDDWGPEYLDNRLKVGRVHVKVNLDPHYVELVMSFLRTESMAVILAAFPDGDEAAEMHGSLSKVLDLDLLLINVAYGQERMERLHKFTKFPPVLIERAIRLG